MPRAARTEKARQPAHALATGNGQMADRNPPSSVGDGVTPGGEDPDLARFLTTSLRVLQDQVRHNLYLQQAMMSVVSTYCLSPRGNDAECDGRAIPPDLLAALQSDDLIRQRQENIERALAVLQQAIAEVPPAAGQGESSLQRQQRWMDAVLESQFLEEMRNNFSAGYSLQADA